MKVEYYRIPEVEEEERPTIAQAQFLFIQFSPVKPEPYFIETILFKSGKKDISKHCCEKIQKRV